MNIICKYNEYGFLTYTSQPGDEYENVIYKSPLHRYQRNGLIATPIGQAIRKQRAFVRGFMKLDLANKIYQELQGDKNIRIRTEDHNEIFDLDVKWGSINFLDETALDSEDDTDCSYNLGLPLRKSFGLIYPNISIPDADIVEVEIFDIRWNNNEELWSRLLNLLRSATLSNKL